MINAFPMKRAAVGLFVGFLLLASPILATAIPAVVLTNTGQVAEGSLSGLDPVPRLASEDVTFIGPGIQFDVPLSSILQIVIDFPRLIVETSDRVLVGPFSAFRGIGQEITLDRPREGSLVLSTASLRAIALNGAPLHDVPREWLGDRFLTEPKVVATSPLHLEPSEAAATLPSEEDLVPIWNAFSPTLVPAEEEAGLPWWVSLLGVAAFVGLLLLVSGQIGQ
jgi:hypothetical protein